MQNYRRAIKDHFEGHPFLGNLLMADIISYSLGILFLFFYEFSIIRLNSDFLFALGFWLFLFGIGLSFVKKSDISLTVGLGLYGFLYLVDFIRVCVNSSNGYSGFYGFTSLCNVIVASFLLILTVRASEYYKKHLEQQKAYQQFSQSAPMPQQSSQGMIRCSKCGGGAQHGMAFCPHCGNKIIEVHRCKQCNSQLPEHTSFCVVCGAKAEVDGNGFKVEIKESKPEPSIAKNLCPSCGVEIIGDKKFCTKCGSKV